MGRLGSGSPPQTDCKLEVGLDTQRFFRAAREAQAREECMRICELKMDTETC